MKNLYEDSRSELVSRSKKGAEYKSDKSKGRNRYERRKHSKVLNSVKEFNSIDMNKLFKDSILDVSVKVKGETDDYLVRISFGSFLGELQRELENKKQDKISIKSVTRALVKAFNDEDVYISCSCPDWKYRMGYWATVNDINSGAEETRPSNITNPNDDKGPGCKHTLLVISNNSWIIKVASVIHNYVNYMEKYQEKLYQDIIRPALYVNKAEIDNYKPDDTQLSIFDDDDIVTVRDTKKKSILYNGPQKDNPYKDYEWEYNDEKDYYECDNLTMSDKNQLRSTSDELDIANRWARTKNQFKKGNQSGIQFVPNPNGNTKQINFDELISDTE